VGKGGEEEADTKNLGGAATHAGGCFNYFIVRLSRYIPHHSTMSNYIYTYKNIGWLQIKVDNRGFGFVHKHQCMTNLLTDADVLFTAELEIQECQSLKSSDGCVPQL